MTMLMTPDKTFLSQFLEAYLKAKPIMGSTKKDAEKNEAQNQGYKQGLAASLAFYGNQLRLEEWRKLNPDPTKQHWIPQLLEHDFLRWVRDVDKRWAEGLWTDKSDSEFYEEMHSEYMELVHNEEWTKWYDSTRRDAVRYGRIEPTPEDAAWIQEELDTYLVVAQPLKALLKKIDNPK